MGPDSRVLVTGGNGQVGRALRAMLPDARFLSHSELDVTNAKAVKAALRGQDFVVHLAAATNVDGCEADPGMAERVNSLGTAHVVDAADEAGARVLYTSTDYVFDGTQRGEYTEEDEPAPLNAYGRSKLNGETQVLKSERNLVVRTSWVYGEGHNFVRTMLRLAREKTELFVVDDQFGRPTYAHDLAAALSFLMNHHADSIVHVSGSGPRCSWADLAEETFRCARASTAVRRVDSKTYEQRASRPVAPRPPNSMLALDKARRLGVPLRDWEEALREYVTDAAHAGL